MRHTRQKNKSLTSLYLVIVIIVMLFIMFILPLMFDEYRENSFLTTIIIFSVLLISAEGLVKKNKN